MIEVTKAWSTVYNREVEIIHEYVNDVGQNLYHCTWPGIDNSSGYVIHNILELRMVQET